MKKIFLSIFLLINCMSLHASEQSSWFGKNKAVGIAAATTTALSGAYTGLALWGLSRVNKASQILDKAKDIETKLEAEQKELQEILDANSSIREIHMSKATYGMGVHIAKLRKDPDNVSISSYADQFVSYNVNHKMTRDSCYHCWNEMRDFNHAKRQYSCKTFDEIYDGLNSAVNTRKKVVDEDLESARRTIGSYPKTSLADDKQSMKRYAIIGSIATLTSLGILGWNKYGGGKCSAH